MRPDADGGDRELVPTGADGTGGPFETGEDCVHLDVTVADGRTAAAQAAELGADVWIPDDTSWLGGADALAIAEAPAGGSGTVVATSPIYMVSDDSTAAQIEQAGGGGGHWRTW